MKLSIVIPNYNGRHLLEKNLPNVIKASKVNEIVVVDDASTDGSPKLVKDNFPEIKLITHENNQGFAAACNTGFHNSEGDIVILLNSDCYPEKNFTEPLIKHFKNPKVFAVGCLEVLNGKTRGKSVGRFERGLFLHSEASDRKPGITMWAFAASAAFHKDKWLELGGMDSLFKPAYWEDIDISWRAWKKGWKVIFEPKSRVHHKPESTNLDVFGIGKIKKISAKNQILFIWKNIHDKKLIIQHLLWLPLHLSRAMINLDLPFIKGFLAAVLQIQEAIKRRINEVKNIKTGDLEILKKFNKL